MEIKKKVVVKNIALSTLYPLLSDSYTHCYQTVYWESSPPPTHTHNQTPHRKGRERRYDRKESVCICMKRKIRKKKATVSVQTCKCPWVFFFPTLIIERSICKRNQEVKLKSKWKDRNFLKRTCFWLYDYFVFFLIVSQEKEQQ